MSTPGIPLSLVLFLLLLQASLPLSLLLLILLLMLLLLPPACATAFERRRVARGRWYGYTDDGGGGLGPRSGQGENIRERVQDGRIKPCFLQGTSWESSSMGSASCGKTMSRESGRLCVLRTIVDGMGCQKCTCH